MPKQQLDTDRLMRPIAHFSHAVRIGDVIHIGATAGTDAARRLAGTTSGLADAAAQSAQMFRNIATGLEAFGASVRDIVRLKIYLADLRDLSAYRAAFNAALGDQTLDHAIVGAWGFPLPQALLEADVVAVVGKTKTPFTCTIGPAAEGSAGGMTPAAQMNAALDRLDEQLANARLGRRDIVNLHVTLADARDLAAFISAYRWRFQAPFPAVTLVGAPLTDPYARVQIEATAVAGGGEPILVDGVRAAFEYASPAVAAGDDVYLSAQSGFDETQPSGIEPQTRATWAALTRVLAAAGLTREHILRTSNVLVDWRDYQGFNAGYGANVTTPYPPRVTVLNTLAHPLARVQIEGLAHRHGDRATVLTVPGPLGSL